MGLLYEERTRAILGAFYAVHSELGAGFLEIVYQRALCVALCQLGHHVERERRFEVVFRGTPIGVYKADLIVDHSVVVEVKAGKAIDQSHTTQLMNYLRVSGVEVGLVLNFGARAQAKRIIHTRNRFTADEP